MFSNTKVLALQATVALAAIAFNIAPCEAISASPEPYEINGVKCHIYGDEHEHYEADENGYTIAYGEDKKPYYAEGVDESGKLRPSKIPVGVEGAAEITKLEINPNLRPNFGLLREAELNMPLEDDEGKELPPRRRLTPQEIQAENIRMEEESLNEHKRLLATTTRRNLVILVRFSDHGARALPSRLDISRLFNTINAASVVPAIAPTGSVRDYYRDQSYGDFDVLSYVTEWITVPYTEDYASAPCSALCGTAKLRRALRNAIAQAVNNQGYNLGFFDQDNDNKIDMISFLTSSYGAEFGGVDSSGTPTSNRVWSHKWSLDVPVTYNGVTVSKYFVAPALWGTSGSNIGRIGVIAHELGHYIGLPDLYDTDSTEKGAGLGSWGLMANSWGFQGNQLYPPSMSAWSKVKVGFVNPMVISNNWGVDGNTYNFYMNPVQIAKRIIKIEHGYMNKEYLLIENRQVRGYDQKAPQGGLMIYHIDDNMSSNNAIEGYPGHPGFPSKHYRVQVIESDNQWNLPKNQRSTTNYRGDPWRVGGPRTVLSSTTSPDLKSYLLQSLCPAFGKKAYTGLRIQVTSTSGTHMFFKLTIDHNDGCVNSYPVLTPSPTKNPTPYPTKMPTPFVFGTLPPKATLPPFSIGIFTKKPTWFATLPPVGLKTLPPFKEDPKLPFGTSDKDSDTDVGPAAGSGASEPAVTENPNGLTGDIATIGGAAAGGAALIALAATLLVKSRRRGSNATTAPESVELGHVTQMSSSSPPSPDVMQGADPTPHTTTPDDTDPAPRRAKGSVAGWIRKFSGPTEDPFAGFAVSNPKFSDEDDTIQSASV